ncbi:MAG: hypothetical protein HY042_11745 [Spirochaetia bacterium]|nr:hypothetical protein [Spirochaetia bacterium]
MRVKLKAAHLLRRLEQIDRDLEELERLRNSIKDDRHYAERIRASLAEEIVRLKELESRILGQVIKNPPEFLARPVGSREDGYVDEPEVMLPGRSRGKTAVADEAADRESHKPDASEEKSARIKTKPAGAKEKPPGNKPGSFQFRYN